MNVKLLVLLICTYLLAFTLNVVPSIKHPDATITMLNGLVTALFIITLLWFVKQGLTSLYATKILNSLFIFAVISCILVFLIKTLENSMFDYVILDAIAAIQYPLYLLFITPLFGANILFDLNYGLYSLMMVTIYAIAIVLNMKRIYLQKS